MHPQSNQESQQYQMLYRYPGSHNQYGQQVGNQTSSSTSNQQLNFGYSQYCVSRQNGQNGMYPPQAGYRGNGSYGMSSACQNSGTTAPPSYNISSGYSMLSHGNQNFQTPQSSTTQLQQASSVTTQHYQTNTTSPTYIVQNTLRQSQLETPQDCRMQNNPHANMTQCTPIQSLVFLVQNNQQPNLNTAVMSNKGLQISGKHQDPGTNANQKRIDGQHRADGQNPMQASTGSLHALQTNYQSVNGQTLNNNITLPTAPHTATSLPLYMNNSSSLSSSSSGLNGVAPPPYPDRTQTQITQCRNMHRATSDANDLTTKTKGLPPPYKRGKWVDYNSLHTNQNNPKCDKLKSNENGATIHWSNSVVYRAPLQQQNFSAASSPTSWVQQQVSPKGPDLTYHGPNKSNATLKQKQTPLLCSLLARGNNTNTDKFFNKDTATSLGNIVHSPLNRSVQICRAVVVVPPISQQPADGANTNCDASSSLKIKDVRSLADEKQTDGGSDSSILKVPSSKVQVSGNNSPPKDVTTAKGPSQEQPSACPNRNSLHYLIKERDRLTKSATAFSLQMVRKLVADRELTEERQLKNNKNAQDVARSILDVCWGGKYKNYEVAELSGTFENILREAAKFDIEEDKQVFYGMKVKQLKHLRSMYNSTTDGFGFDVALENTKSSWRNLSDESLDIDKELADRDFLQENFPSLLEKKEKRDFLDNTQTSDTISTISSLDLVPEPRDCPKSPDDVMVDIKLNESLDTDMELSDIGFMKEGFPSMLAKTEKRDCLNNSAQMCDNSQDLDPELRECSKSPGDAMVDIKVTVSPSENESEAVDSESVSQDVTAMEEDPSTPSVITTELSQKSDKECPESPDEGMLSMKITVLSMDELGGLLKLFDKDSSLACLDGDDTDVEFVNSCQSEDTFTPPVHKKAKLDGTQTTKSEKKENEHLIELNGKEKANPAKDSRKENYTLKHQQHMHEENRHLTQSHLRSKHQSVQTRAKLPRLEIPSPNPSPSGVKASSPISPSAAIKKKTSGGIKRSSLAEAGDTLGIKRPSASLEISIPFNTFQPLPSKKRESHCGNSDSLANKLTKKSSTSKDTTNAPAKQRHEAGSPTSASRESILKSRDEIKQVKRAIFRIYGAKRVDPKEKNRKTKYYSDCMRDFPPVLSVVYSPEKSSARHKIIKSWEVSYVPTSKVRRQCDSGKRPSSPEVGNKEKNVAVRHVEHEASFGKDKKEQHHSPGKDHQSKHKKHAKHRAFSLNELRRNAETRGGSKLSPQEKNNMALSVLKHYKRIHVKH